MMRKVSLLTLAVATLAACQAPPGAVGPAEAPLLAGRVEFPLYTLKAESTDVLQNAVVSLTDDTGATVAAGVTDAAGNFSLYRSTQPFAPSEGQGFVLSVAKRVGGLDRPLLTLRTEVVRRAAGWDSITGADIVINLLTSAVTKLDEQDAEVTFETVMGKVEAGLPLAFGRYSPSDVTAAKTALQASLTANADPAGAWLYEGDYTITDQASLEALQRYDGVDGTLTLASDSPLTTLTLPNLRIIRGSLSITDNAHLENLDGLGALTEVSNANIGNCSKLTSIRGLSKLAKTRYGVTVSGNPLLTSLEGLDGLVVSGTVNISGNAALVDADHLGRLRQVNGSVTVRDNPALTTFGPLTRLETVSGSLTFESNDQLTTIGAMPALQRVGRFALTYNPLLTQVGNLSGMDALESLTIDANDALTNLDFLSGMTRLTGDFAIVNNPALVSLGGLSALTRIGTDDGDSGYFALENNDALTSLAGLESLARTNGATIEFNAALTSLSALESLVQINGTCRVRYNPELRIANCAQPLPQAGATVTNGYLVIDTNHPENCQ
jgi:hypothetical protein